MRHFEILSVVVDPGAPGPERLWKIYYKAYKNKKWIQTTLWIEGRNEKQARERAMIRFGDKVR